jgi:hypothetical protein
MTEYAELIKEIDKLPAKYIGEIFDFVGYLRQKTQNEKGDDAYKAMTADTEPVNTGFYEKQKKLAALRQLSQELIELNKTDPLPPEFDDILSQRVKFREIANL